MPLVLSNKFTKLNHSKRRKGDCWNTFILSSWMRNREKKKHCNNKVHVPHAPASESYIFIAKRKGQLSDRNLLFRNICVCMLVWTLGHTRKRLEKNRVYFRCLIHITVFFFAPYSLIFIPFETEQPIWTCSKIKGHHQTNGLYKCMIYVRVKTEPEMLKTNEKKDRRNSCTFSHFFLFFFLCFVCLKLKRKNTSTSNTY